MTWNPERRRRIPDERKALIELVEKQADGDLVREMLAFAAEDHGSRGRGAHRRHREGARSPLREVRRDGYRERDRDTRAGRIALEIPNLRECSCFPSFLERAARPRRHRRRHPGSLYAWRRLLDMRPALMAFTRSSTERRELSRLCAEIDERVNAFLTRPLEGVWPCLWRDATCLKSGMAAGSSATPRQSPWRSTRTASGRVSH